MTTLRRLLPILGLLAGLAAPAQDLEPGGGDGDVIKEFAGELGVSLEGTRIRLVKATAPEEGIDGLFWRSLPRQAGGYTAACTFPVKVKFGANEAIAPRQEPLPNEQGMTTIYEPFGKARLPAGDFLLAPGGIPFTQRNGQLASAHPAVQIVGDEIRLRCARVRFEVVEADGAPVPARLSVTDTRVPLLREEAAFNPLLVWLPVGCEYQSTLGSFRLEGDGALVPLKLAEGISVTAEGLRRQLPPREAGGQAPPVTANWHLWTPRGRTVFAQPEQPVFQVLVPAGFDGGEATVSIDGREAGRLPLPAVEGGSGWDARGFTLALDDLPPGEHTLEIAVPGLTGQAYRFRTVGWREESPFLVQSMSCCTPNWPTDDAGLELLREAGLAMVTATGHASLLDVRLPELEPPADPKLPAELGLRRSANDELLERLLAHRLRYIDLTVARGANFYNEGLSYHHSYGPSVERMIRRMQIFTQQTGDYPSWLGVNYGWFPKLEGYIEGGVPVDAHIVPRREALDGWLAERGMAPVSKADRERYLAQRFSADPAERQEAEAILARLIAYWQGRQERGFGDHNALYNEAVRQVRPETACVLFDNAGHDLGNRTRSQFRAMDAVAYETYTDYGPWPMGAAFSTEWARGTSPGQPVWITADWGTSTDDMLKSLFHAFARGLQGGGVPMQENVERRELERRGMGLRFLRQIGSVARFARPDDRVGILATRSQRVLDFRAYYGYHTIWSHLTRLGYPAAVVDEEDVLAAKAVPEQVRVLWLVRQEQPLGAELTAALKAFVERGGKLLATGDTLAEAPGMVKVGGETRDIWRMSGFLPQAHQDLWREFQEVWREPLEEAMAGTTVRPAATTDPLRGYALAMDAGPVRYVTVLADAADSHSREVPVVRGLPVSLEGTGWRVRELVHQRDLEAEEADGRSEVTVDLVTEPVAVLALYRSPPAKVAVQAESAGTIRWRAAVTAEDGSELGPVPLRFRFLAPDGAVRETLWYAAGDEVEFTPPAREPGTWQVEVQELLTGLTATMAWEAPAGAAALAEPLPEVHVTDRHQLAEFVRAEGEKLIIVEPGQRALLPLAESLVERLREAGAEVRLWVLRPEEFNAIPTRWFPRPEEQADLALVAERRLIGWRQDLQPHIDKQTRQHLPERGGYVTIQPPWMVGAHCLVFGGGRLAESLAAVTAWAPTPNLPGRGQARLVTTFSPFGAGRQALLVAAHDPAGFARAADYLATHWAGLAEPAGETPAVVAAPLSLSAGKLAPGEAPTPLAGLRPWRRVKRLAALADGRAAIQLDGKQNTFAILTGDGAIGGLFAAEAELRQLTGDGRLWLAAGGREEVELWTYDAAGRPVGRLPVFAKAPDLMIPPNRSLADSFLATPDGQRLMLGRFGSLEVVSEGGASTVSFQASAQRRYEIWSPRFPVGMTMSADGQALFYTLDTRPNGFTNMSGHAFHPEGNEAVLLELATLERRWALHGEPGKYVTHSGFAAVANGGALTALSDYLGFVYLVDGGGRVILEHRAVEAAPGSRPHYAWGAPGGVGTWLSPGGELAAFGFENQLLLASGGRLTGTVPMTRLVAGAVAADGSFALAAEESGTVIAFNPDGSERWRFEAGGLEPRLAALAGNQTLLTNHHGQAIRLDAEGKQIWRTEVAAEADRAAPALAEPGAPGVLPAVSGVAADPLLELARTHLKARQLSRWEAGGQADEQPGFGEIAAPRAFGHLVYAWPGEGRAPAIVTGGREGSRRFLLDVPTDARRGPRAVNIPVRGPGASLRLEPGEGMELVEFSLWSFEWPSPNIALIHGAGAATDVSLTEAKDDLDDLGDLGDLDQDGRGLSGQMKPVRIYFWNRDPDKVKGTFLAAGANPLTVVDGNRFDAARPTPWATDRDPVGTWFVVDFPYPAAIQLVATCDGATAQSQVATQIAVFTDFDPAGEEPQAAHRSGRVLAGAIDNLEFWRLFALPPGKLRQLGVHIRRADGRQALSEIEAYLQPTR